MFKFQPMQRVMITLHELNYEGRIIRCIQEECPTRIYDVSYCNNVGELKRAEFFEDELNDLMVEK